MVSMQSDQHSFYFNKTCETVKANTQSYIPGLQQETFFI